MNPTPSSLRSLCLRVLAVGVVVLGLPAGLHAESGQSDGWTVRIQTPVLDAGAGVDTGLPFDGGLDAHPRPRLGAESTGGEVDADAPADGDLVGDGCVRIPPGGGPRGPPAGTVPGAVALRIHLRHCGHLSDRLDLPPPLLS